jgi:hypothetical protein
MHGGFNAVVHFQVQLGKLVFLVGRSFLDVPQRGRIDNVADNEPLDSLIFGNGFASGDTTDTLNVTTALLITSMIASFDRHLLLSDELKKLRG